MDPTRHELDAAIEARSELGADLEPYVIEAFVERIEQRIEQRARELAQPSLGPDRTIAIASLVIAIPLLGIAGGTAGLAGIALVCIAIVLVNVVAARR